MISNLTSKQIKTIFNKFKKIHHTKKPQKIQFNILQKFTQFQTYIITTYNLNSLLNFPFQKHQIQLLFYNQFLHNFYKILKKKKYNIQTLLQKKNKLKIFYNKIIKKFNNNKTIFYQQNSQNSKNTLQ